LNKIVVRWKVENYDVIGYNEIGRALKDIYNILGVLVETRNEIQESGSPETKENSWFLREHTAAKHSGYSGYNRVYKRYVRCTGAKGVQEFERYEKAARKTKKDK